MQYMPKTDLPPASTTVVRNIKMGRFEVKVEKPKKTSEQVQEALNQLKKAAKDKVFIDNSNTFKCLENLHFFLKYKKLASGRSTLTSFS